MGHRVCGSTRQGAKRPRTVQARLFADHFLQLRGQLRSARAALKPLSFAQSLSDAALNVKGRPPGLLELLAAADVPRALELRLVHAVDQNM